MQGNKSNYRGLGSIDFQATARSVLIVGRLKDNPQIRVMVQDKSSLAPEGEPIAFELDKENGFRWLGHYDISADNLLCGIPREKKSEQAENLILEYLSQGKYPQQALLKKAQAIGISKRVLDEAKKELNVRSLKEGQSVVLGASRKNGVRVFKVAILQKLAHLQPCNVPFSGSNKVWWESAESTFSKVFFAPRRAHGTSLQPSG